jgi:hypothetical protein
VDRYEELITTRRSRSNSQTGSQIDIYAHGRELELENKLRSIANQGEDEMYRERGRSPMYAEVGIGGIGIGGSRPGTLVHSRPSSLSNRSISAAVAQAPQPQPYSQLAADRGVFGRGLLNGVGGDYASQNGHNVAANERLKELMTVNPKPIVVTIDPTKNLIVNGATAATNTTTRKLLEIPANLFPKNFPQWFILTYTYSAVLIAIILISKVTPDGQLYIYFVAFWSLMLYFYLDDEQQGVDPLESVIEGLVSRRPRPSSAVFSGKAAGNDVTKITALYR